MLHEYGMCGDVTFLEKETADAGYFRENSVPKVT
jgi:hypothetical protein